jgi:hypothetical protein
MREEGCLPLFVRVNGLFANEGAPRVWISGGEFVSLR